MWRTGSFPSTNQSTWGSELTVKSVCENTFSDMKNMPSSNITPYVFAFLALKYQDLHLDLSFEPCTFLRK